MTAPRILIACIGNIFLGDDGFGTEVARQLARRDLPPDVILKDFGIRSLDLTYALLDPYELVILVDACARGGTPGTVYLLEADIPDDGTPAALETHNMNPAHVLRMARSLGEVSARVLVVGCEPARTEAPDSSDESDEEGQSGLSEPVAAAVDEAIAMIENLIGTVAVQPQASAWGV